MEINHSNRGKSDQIIWSLDEQHNYGQSRTYTCTFCKRGFSNAQALGGHMNIHRKDRAMLKLQASSDESLLSLDISRSTSAADQPEASGEKSVLLSESSGQDRSNIPKRSNSSSIEDDRAPPKSKDDSEEVQKLTLFVDTNKERSSTCTGEDEDTMTEMSHGSSQVELDLELRLGPKPNETSTRSTRDFF